MRSRRLLVLSLVAILLAVTPVYAQLEDTQTFQKCKYCGMDRQQFSHSRMLLKYDDGTTIGTCSLHCVAVDLAEAIDKTPQTIQVADFGTKKLIDAETAVWVIGGNKPGVMTKRAKWAFEKKDDADAFIKENGGNLGTLDDAMRASYEDMYTDTKMIREKRKMKKGQMQEHKAQ